MPKYLIGLKDNIKWPESESENIIRIKPIQILKESTMFHYQRVSWLCVNGNIQDFLLGQLIITSTFCASQSHQKPFQFGTQSVAAERFFPQWEANQIKYSGDHNQSVLNWSIV